MKATKQSAPVYTLPPTPGCKPGELLINGVCMVPPPKGPLPPAGPSVNDATPICTSFETLMLGFWLLVAGICR